VSQKTGPLTAYNFRNIEQIFTKFGTNQSLFILNIVPEFILINFGKLWRHLVNENDTSTTTSFELVIILLHHFSQPFCISLFIN